MQSVFCNLKGSTNVRKTHLNIVYQYRTFLLAKLCAFGPNLTRIAWSYKEHLSWHQITHYSDFDARRFVQDRWRKRIVFVFFLIRFNCVSRRNCVFKWINILSLLSRFVQMLKNTFSPLTMVVKLHEVSSRARITRLISLSSRDLQDFALRSTDIYLCNLDFKNRWADSAQTEPWPQKYSPPKKLKTEPR